MKTVAHKNIESWWDGKVLIDEVREYIDTRGSLVELWREDDEVMNSGQHSSKMSYWSVTKPYIMRGPHQHSPAQIDFFYTFKNKMVYQLYNPETNEMKIYFTNPNVITRVKVAPPIIHSYRSLEIHDITTANFPTSLFMGENKKSPIDEIRWEEKFIHNPVVFVFGANGRLGKALTKTFFDNMGFHEFEVVPCCEKIKNNEELQIFLNKLESLFKGRDLYFFNCAALTNVQDSTTTFDVWDWSNVKLPTHIANYCCANKWKFIGFSTDYVYRSSEDDKNMYIKSKKLFETTIKNLGDCNITILRVANLFSSDINDTHNMIVKFKNSIKNNKPITLDPNLSVYPTNVDVLSTKIVEMFKKGIFINDSIKYYNFIPKKYNLVEFFNKFFKEPCYINDSNIILWDDKFENDPNATIIELESNEDDINKIIYK